MPLQELQIYEFGRFQLDAKERTLRFGADIVTLTPKVFDLLLLLVENQGKLLEKEFLLKTLWPDTFVEEANLSVNISTLRRALGQTSSEATFIETVPKRGYRFVAPVTMPAPPIPANNDVIAARRSGFSGVALAAGILALAAIALWVYVGRRTVTQQNLQSLAVLPFRSLTAQTEEERLGAGMANALIRRITNLQKMTVRPASAVLKYANHQGDPVEIGRQLKVDALLDGTIEREGDKIRVSVQLFRVRDGASLWAEQFDDYFTNIFAVQDSISEIAARKLSLKLNEFDTHWMNKRYTETTEAYSAYLQGQYYANLRTKRDTATAIDYFLQAIAKDPNFALAHTELASAYINLAGTGQYSDLWEKAQQAAQTATRIDGSLSEAHLALGRVYMRRDWNWDAADKEFRRTLAIDPHFAAAHSSRSTLLTALGRHDEAIQGMQTACDLDPQSANHRSDLAWTYYCVRRNKEAIEHSKISLLLDASSDVAHRQLEKEYAQAGLYKEAMEQYQLAHDSKNRQASGSAADLAVIYARAGRKGEAEVIYRNFQQLPNPEGISNYSYSMAVLAANLGRIEEAFAYLKRAQEQKLARAIWMKVDPELDALRSDPRFRAMLKESKLSQ